MMHNQRILVVDEHPVVRDGLRLLLHSDTLLHVTSTAASGQAAIARVKELEPDIVILDLRLPDIPAVEVIASIRSIDKTTRIVVFTASTERDQLKQALDAGADGILMKDISGVGLSSALRRILQGEQVVDPRVAPEQQASAGTPARPDLTRREYEILRLAANGRTTPEIAQITGLTRTVVQAGLQSVLQQIGARSRAEAIEKAVETGLV